MMELQAIQLEVVWTERLALLVTHAQRKKLGQTAVKRVVCVPALACVVLALTVR